MVVAESVVIMDKFYIIKFFYKDTETSSRVGYSPQRIITIAEDSDHAYAKLENDTIDIGGVSIIDVWEINIQDLKNNITYI